MQPVNDILSNKLRRNAGTISTALRKAWFIFIWNALCDKIQAVCTVTRVFIQYGIDF